MTDAMAFAEKYGPWGVVIGASEGIGLAYAAELAHRGVNSVLVARTPAKLDKAATQIRRTNPGAEVRTISVDLSLPDGPEKLIAATADLEVGILIYSVGTELAVNDFVSNDWTLHEGLIQRNVVSNVRLVHHFGGLMVAQGRGGIVLMGSIAGYGGAPGLALYAATKASIHSFAEGLWFELAEQGIHVLAPVIAQTNTPAMVESYGRLESAAEPADIARGALDEIANGPIWIQPKARQAASDRIGSEPRDRARLVAHRLGRMMSSDPVQLS